MQANILDQLVIPRQMVEEPSLRIARELFPANCARISLVPVQGEQSGRKVSAVVHSKVLNVSALRPAFFTLHRIVDRGRASAFRRLWRCQLFSPSSRIDGLFSRQSEIGRTLGQDQQRIALPERGQLLKQLGKLPFQKDALPRQDHAVLPGQVRDELRGTRKLLLAGVAPERGVIAGACADFVGRDQFMLEVEGQMLLQRSPVAHVDGLAADLAHGEPEDGPYGTCFGPLDVSGRVRWACYRFVVVSSLLDFGRVFGDLDLAASIWLSHFFSGWRMTFFWKGDLKYFLIEGPVLCRNGFGGRNFDTLSLRGLFGLRLMVASIISSFLSRLDVLSLIDLCGILNIGDSVAITNMIKVRYDVLNNRSRLDRRLLLRAQRRQTLRVELRAVRRDLLQELVPIRQVTQQAPRGAGAAVLLVTQRARPRQPPVQGQELLLEVHGEVVLHEGHARGAPVVKVADAAAVGLAGLLAGSGRVRWLFVVSGDSALTLCAVFFSLGVILVVHAGNGEVCD